MKEYVCILMDPPWAERGGGKCKRGADKHYQVMSTGQILKAILGSGCFTPAADAHLWMWATNNYLADALWLYEELGFRYVTNFPWVKGSIEERGDLKVYKPARMGIGQYARGCHELLLFGVRGSGFAASSTYPNGHPSAGKMRKDVRSDWLVGVPTVSEEGKILHSRKPPEQYRLIEARTKAGPRLEMFARTRHSEAWDVWGNEAPLRPGPQLR